MRIWQIRWNWSEFPVPAYPYAPTSGSRTLSREARPKRASDLSQDPFSIALEQMTVSLASPGAISEGASLRMLTSHMGPDICWGVGPSRKDPTR